MIKISLNRYVEKTPSNSDLKLEKLQQQSICTTKKSQRPKMKPLQIPNSLISSQQFSFRNQGAANAATARYETTTNDAM